MQNCEVILAYPGRIGYGAAAGFRSFPACGPTGERFWSLYDESKSNFII